MATEDSSAKEGKAGYWLPVLITESVVILIINAITIIAFARIRNLRKRNTYLIINLTVADLLVGAVTGPLLVYLSCKDKENNGFTWPGFIIWTFEFNFVIASQVNLFLISLERLHATLFPFRHCLISEYVYFKIIVGSWSITFLLGSLMAGLYLKATNGGPYVWASFNVLTLLVIAVSYIIIIVKVQRSPYSQHCSTNKERKLSVTLLVVTGVSFLTILPSAIYNSVPVDLRRNLSNESRLSEIHHALTVIYFASSIVNPLIYTIRMQEFRKALGNLLSKSNEPNRDHPLKPWDHAVP